jgi:hypothetical protein
VRGAVASRDRGGEGGVEIGRQAMVQSPRNRDRAFALMADIPGWTEAPEGSLIGTESSEEHHACALLDVAEVADPSRS